MANDRHDLELQNTQSARPLEQACENTKNISSMETDSVNDSLKELLARVRGANDGPKPKDSVATLLARLEKELSQTDDANKTYAKVALESLLVRIFPETANRKDASSSTIHQVNISQSKAFDNQLVTVEKVRSDAGQTAAPVPIERQLIQAREDGYQNGWKKGREVGMKIGEAKGVEKGRKTGRWGGVVKK